MRFRDDYGSLTTLGIASVVAGAVAVITIIVILICNSFVNGGKIVSAVMEPQRIYYTQEDVAQYHNVTRTRTTTDSDGNSRTETYFDKVFDHYDYVVYKNIDNVDYVVVISGKNGFDRVKNATFYVTENRFKTLNTMSDNVGYFYFNRKLGDSRIDINNQKIEVNRSHIRQDMSQYR